MFLTAKTGTAPNINGFGDVPVLLLVMAFSMMHYFTYLSFTQTHFVLRHTHNQYCQASRPVPRGLPTGWHTAHPESCNGLEAAYLHNSAA
jgi:hypothetical protein